MKNPNTFNSMPTYGELEKLKELTPPNQMSEEMKKERGKFELALIMEKGKPDRI